jgi:hypothetical protein
MFLDLVHVCARLLCTVLFVSNEIRAVGVSPTVFNVQKREKERPYKLNVAQHEIWDD